MFGNQTNFFGEIMERVVTAVLDAIALFIETFILNIIMPFLPVA